MSYYCLDENMRVCTKEELHEQSGYQYVAVLTTHEWNRERDFFDMGIELEPDTEDILNTKAEVNYDSLTGTFQIPDRKNLQEHASCFAFALDEKGIVFIDDSGKAEQMISEIRRRKHWREPCLERFLYDFLEQIVDPDLAMMEGYEQELEENENGFFSEENLRYMHLFMNRIMRRHATAGSLRDYTMQVRDLYNSQLEASQNRTMTLLTVITTIFLPLTLIVGWYGMNFRYMPELKWKWGYPVIILVSILIVVLCLLLFKKKKWL